MIPILILLYNNHKITIKNKLQLLQVEDIVLMVQQSRNYQEKAQLISTVVSISVGISNTNSCIFNIICYETDSRIALHDYNNSYLERKHNNYYLQVLYSKRKRHILNELNSFRITITDPPGRRWYSKLLPWNRTNNNNDNEQYENECPICLIEFTTGEIAIQSNFCHCKNSIFHEHCITIWLFDKQRNPNKLCPCCRNPFIPPPAEDKSSRKKEVWGQTHQE